MSARRILLAETLRLIVRERENSFAECGPLAHRLLHDYQEEGNPAEFVWNDLPNQRNIEDVADLLGLWCWYSNDNGSSIFRTTEEWITACTDQEHIAVALNLDAYPFIDRNEMNVALENRYGEISFPEIAMRGIDK